MSKDCAEPVTATAPPIEPSTNEGWAGRLAWGLAGTLFVIFAVVSLTNLQSGMHGGSRTTNPHPGAAPYPPFLGVNNWPLILSCLAVVLTVGFFGAALWLSVRQRRVHWSVVVGIATFFAGAVDPLANWATFTVFDPRIAHFPVSWPYVNASPLLEPTLSFLGGYASYYALTGIGLVRGYQHLVQPHLRVGTWLARHRLFAVFLTGFTLGLPLNAVMQFLWLKAGMFVYTEAAGPVLRLGDIYLPLVMVVYDSLIFAVVAMLCVIDDNGRPELVAKLAQRLTALRGRQRLTTGRQVIVATAVLLVVVLAPVGVLGLLRVGGFAKPAYDQFPYPAVKIYDPYGDLDRAGMPGPFYQ